MTAEDASKLIDQTSPRVSVENMDIEKMLELLMDENFMDLEDFRLFIPMLAKLWMFRPLRALSVPALRHLGGLQSGLTSLLVPGYLAKQELPVPLLHVLRLESCDIAHVLAVALHVVLQLLKGVILPVLNGDGLEVGDQVVQVGLEGLHVNLRPEHGSVFANHHEEDVELVPDLLEVFEVAQNRVEGLRGDLVELAVNPRGVKLECLEDHVKGLNVLAQDVDLVLNHSDLVQHQEGVLHERDAPQLRPLRQEFVVSHEEELETELEVALNLPSARENHVGEAVLQSLVGLVVLALKLLNPNPVTREGEPLDLEELLSIHKERQVSPNLLILILGRHHLCDQLDQRGVEGLAAQREIGHDGSLGGDVLGLQGQGGDGRGVLIYPDQPLGQEGLQLVKGLLDGGHGCPVGGELLVELRGIEVEDLPGQPVVLVHDLRLDRRRVQGNLVAKPAQILVGAEARAETAHLPDKLLPLHQTGQLAGNAAQLNEP
ncbi:hypothetical protein OJ253_3681 [Cryptosporidium canis]|uniref:Uncharacterized protein n=1 Tax=Cryptosporidium canis TaxID=195482 RepID=A0A9D5HVN7_9CRYT|nr:hypothetical protein OJ253_3681 [Cryptosporidium canis]